MIIKVFLTIVGFLQKADGRMVSVQNTRQWLICTHELHSSAINTGALDAPISPVYGQAVLSGFAKLLYRYTLQFTSGINKN